MSTSRHTTIWCDGEGCGFESSMPSAAIEAHTKQENTMTIRSTTSQFQPSPPNYRLTQSGPYHNIGRYRSITRTTEGPTRANMSTAPTVRTTNNQYFYVPRLSG